MQKKLLDPETQGDQQQRAKHQQPEQQTRTTKLRKPIIFPKPSLCQLCPFGVFVFVYFVFICCWSFLLVATLAFCFRVLSFPRMKWPKYHIFKAQENCDLQCFQGVKASWCQGGYIEISIYIYTCEYNSTRPSAKVYVHMNFHTHIAICVYLYRGLHIWAMFQLAAGIVLGKAKTLNPQTYTLGSCLVISGYCDSSLLEHSWINARDPLKGDIGIISWED